MTSDTIAAAFAATPLLPDVAAWRARYNITPTAHVPAVLATGDVRELAMVHWGLIPFWAKEASIGARLANARSETLTEKPAFRDAWRKRRCLLPVTAFYEWQAAATTSSGNVESGVSEGASLFGDDADRAASPKMKGRGRRPSPPPKQPFAFGRSGGGPLALGAIWERWRSPDGAVIRSAAIITVAANDLMRPIHDRMPVIVPEGQWARWLAVETTPDDLLAPAPNSALQAWPVSRLVNSPRNDSAECLRPDLGSA